MQERILCEWPLTGLFCLKGYEPFEFIMFKPVVYHLRMSRYCRSVNIRKMFSEGCLVKRQLVHQNNLCIFILV